MRILYFHQHFSTPQGAVGVRSYHMAKALVDRGHEVVVVCGSYGGGNTGLQLPFRKGLRRGDVNGIDVVEFELPYSNNDGFIKRTWTFLRFAFRSILLGVREPADLVFATSTPLTAAIPGIFARAFTKKKFIFEVRDLWPELPKAMGVIRNPIILWLMGVLEWLAYRSAHGCVGLSPGIVEGIKRRSSSDTPVVMVPNGCDLDLFGNSIDDEWRPEGVSEDDFMAVFAGTHGIANGLDAVLDVATVLKRRMITDIKLVFVGDGKLKASLVSRAANENLDNCVFCDPVPKQRLASLLEAADLGLMILADVPAFYFGTSPNKFFDYIAARLPVLNNYPGWLAQIIRKEGCGYVVPPRNPEAFADALQEAKADREKNRTFGQHAREVAEREFSWSLLTGRLVEFFERVSGQP